jgi:hypothetical protein
MEKKKIIVPIICFVLGIYLLSVGIWEIIGRVALFDWPPNPDGALASGVFGSFFGLGFLAVGVHVFIKKD